MTLLLSVFVLFFIQPAELRPTINDDLPTKEVFDYLIKYGYLREPNTLKWRLLTSSHTKMNERATTTGNQDAERNVKNKAKDVFDQAEIKTAISEFQNQFKLTETGRLDSDTILMMRQMRCGNKDVALDKRATRNPTVARLRRSATHDVALAYAHYPKVQTYTWTFLADTTTDNQFFVNHIEYGMNMWAAVTNVNFKYVPEATETEDTIDIIVRFARRVHGDGRPFDGPGGEIAHTIPAKKDDRETSIEIHFDDDEDWQINFRKDNNLYGRTEKMPDFIQAVIHQVGHALGFPHSHRVRSVMHPPIQLGVKDAAYHLSQYDIHNVKKQKGKCWPPRVDAAYSNRYDGMTYMTIGPFAYQFQRRPEKRKGHPSPLPVVSQTWPRPSRDVWDGFELVDEIFIHGDKHTYFFSGDQYAVHLHSSKGRKGLLTKKKIGKGVNEVSKKEYVGWPGLKHHKYIDAAFSNYSSGETFIFQDDLVYLWDTNKKGNEDEYHLPKGSVADGWPKKIKDVFPHVPNKIDTAFQYYWGDKIYFFKKGFFYAWDNQKRKAKPPKPIKELWTNLCNVYMCNARTKTTDPCRSWDLSRKNCGSLCDE